MSVKNWFATPIYETIFPNYEKQNSILEKRAYELKDKIGDVKTGWLCNTFNTMGTDWRTGNAEEDDIVNRFVFDVCQHVFKFSTHFQIDPKNFNVMCNDFWFNIAAKGDNQEFHQHPNNHFSAVYYVKTPRDCGNIVFKSYECIYDTYSLPIKDVDGSGDTYDPMHLQVGPQRGKLVIFRSSLMHMVERNENKKDRISIAMNFNLVPKQN